MPQQKLDEIEKHATRLGIDTAGPYLDSVGQTDLAALTADQLEAFGEKFVEGYTDGLRKLIAGHIAPF